MTTGTIVHVSDSGPRGWDGKVLAIAGTTLTIQIANGGRRIVDTTKRTVTAVSTTMGR